MGTAPHNNTPMLGVHACERRTARIQVEGSSAAARVIRNVPGPIATMRIAMVATPLCTNKNRRYRWLEWIDHNEYVS